MVPYRRAELIALAASIALFGCAKTVDVPITISLADKICAAQPDITQAKPVSVGSKALNVTVDGNAPCLSSSAGSSLYVVFALPRADKEYNVSVTSNPSRDGILSPRVLMLDTQGHMIREIGRDDFVFHGSALYAGVRVHAGETYLVVASDPHSVGQSISQTVDTTQAQVIPAGVVYATVFTGSTATKNMTYSHTGILVIAAQPIPESK